MLKIALYEGITGYKILIIFNIELHIFEFIRIRMQQTLKANLRS